MCRLSLILTLLLFTSGCAFLKPKSVETVVLDDPECEAIKKVSFKLAEIPPLDLSKYKNIQFLTVEDEDGYHWLTFSTDDYKSFAEFLLILQNYIEIQRESIEKIQEFYLKALEEDEDV